MRLPRRVPWASVSELEQVCSWIFTDEFDLKAKRLAVDRVSVMTSTLIEYFRLKLTNLFRQITSLQHGET